MTGNPLDVALVGPGFPAGELYLPEKILPQRWLRKYSVLARTEPDRADWAETIGTYVF